MTKGIGQITRRDTLKFLGTAFCVSAAAPASAAEAKKPRWKTAVGLNGFQSSSVKYNKTFPIWEVLDFVSRTGFDGVELVHHWPMGDYPPPQDKQRISALKRLYDGFGLKIFSIQTMADGAFAPDEPARKSWLEGWHNQARFAKAAGAECIGLWPGGGLRGQTIDQAIGHFARSLREVAKIADELGLVSSFEIEPPFVFNTEEHIRRILEKANHPSVKTMLDPSHFDLMSGSTGRVHEMLKRIGVENIGYVHLTDTDGTLMGTSKHLPCGDGHVDIDAVLATLLEGGYQGWVMIDAWQIPDPYDACVKGKQAIDRALARV